MSLLTIYSIVESPADDKVGYEPFGAAADLWMCKAPEVIISGPAETGKTRAALEKLDALMWKYPGAQAVMIRKVYNDMHGSCIQTYENKVLGYRPDETSPVKKYGGEKAQFYDYPTSSRLWIAGLDKPSKVLSSERDFAYINQAEELNLNEWETITTRVTGRAGNSPYSQTFGDCNPSYPKHWIKHRQSLTLLHSRHEDNPTLYDRRGNLTNQGKRTMDVLDNLTGNRKERLRYGRWVQAEGVVYPQFDERIHILDRFDIPEDWQKVRVIDFGLVHPFVCGWWAIDEDGRAYLYREIYMTGRTVATHAKQIISLSEGEYISNTICDHDAEDRQTLAENGIPNIPAKKDVLWGIGKVQDRLKKQADGRPRLFFLRDSLVEIDQAQLEQRKPIKTVDEFGGYIWANTQKEQPVKKDDDGLDMTKYLTAYLDRGASGSMSDVPQDDSTGSLWDIEKTGNTGKSWRI